MATTDRRPRDPPAPAEAPGTTVRGPPPTRRPSPAEVLPAWFGLPATGPAQWDWFDAAPGALSGLEITEHAVPADWFARTYGAGRLPPADTDPDAPGPHPPEKA